MSEDLLILNALLEIYSEYNLRNLLNSVLHFSFTTLLKKWTKDDIPFWGKNIEEKQNSATTMISVDEKGTVFPMKLKL